MKVLVFLSICLVAISLAAADSCCGCGCCCGGGGNPPVTPSPPTTCNCGGGGGNPTPSPPTTTLAPGTTCPGLVNTIENLLVQILNLLCYIINNIAAILAAIVNQPSLGDALKELLNQLVSPLALLLSSSSWTDAQAITLGNTIQVILNRIGAILQDLLGGGTEYLCTTVGGTQCTGVAAQIAALLEALTGVLGPDFPLLVPVVNQILGLINNVLGLLD